MDFYQVAMQMEAQGRAYYLKLQEEAKHPRLKQIFYLLAQEEQEHYEVFKRLLTKAPGSVNKGTGAETDTEVLKTAGVAVEGIFAKIVAEGLDFTGEEAFVEAYLKAKQMEEKTATYYKSCLNQAQTPEEKMILLKLYYEEKKHSLFLEHLIELITDPELKAVSAEWDRPMSEEM